jgi:hypothetical protein
MAIPKLLQLRKPSWTRSRWWSHSRWWLGICKHHHRLSQLPWEQSTPWTKHIGVKYFWFRDKCGPGTGISIVKVDSKEQLADIFTNGLYIEQFVILRHTLMGWSAGSREEVLLDLGALSVSWFMKHCWLTNRRNARFLDESQDFLIDPQP